MPRGYYPRAGANLWTPEQKERLERMVLAKQPWPEIAAACGHPKSSCQTMLSYIRRQRRLAAGLALALKPRPSGIVAPPEPVAEPTARIRRLSTLVDDADLRARIAIQGPNGLFGDPLPGRSALDEKRANGWVSR
jgi:hypothetical protein